MLQSKVIKQKAYQIILEGIQDKLDKLPYHYTFTPETREEIKKVIYSEAERIQNKLDKISLRPKGENGSTTIKD